MSKIDINKKYRTRDGREVRIYATDLPGDYPIHGSIKNDAVEEIWELEEWAENGKAVIDHKGEHNFDLICVDDILKLWFIVYHEPRLNLYSIFDRRKKPNEKIGDVDSVGWVVFDIIEKEYEL